MKKNEIQAYLDTVDNWKIWKMIVLIPVAIFFTLMIPSLFVLLGKENGLENSDFNITSIEFYLAIPGKILFFVSVLFSIFLYCFNVKKE